MKKFYHLILYVLVGMSICSCTKDAIESDRPYFQQQRKLLDEARAYFESAIALADAEGTLDTHSSLSPGEITPKWRSAAIDCDDNFDLVFVDFTADYYYIAKERYWNKEKEEKFVHTGVYQVLCIRRDKTTGEMGMAYMTLTPSRGYHQTSKSKTAEYFIHEPNKKDYCGLLFFHDVTTMTLLSVEKYWDGELLTGIYLPVSNTASEFYEQVADATKNNIYLRSHMLITRADGEGYIIDEVIVEEKAITGGGGSGGSGGGGSTGSGGGGLGWDDIGWGQGGNNWGDSGNTGNGGNSGGGGFHDNSGGGGGIPNIPWTGGNGSNGNVGVAPVKPDSTEEKKIIQGTDNETNGSNGYFPDENDKFWDNKIPKIDSPPHNLP